MESVHMNAEQLWWKVSGKFYWHRMKVDLQAFVESCDVCQKVKGKSFNRYGFL
ncbi:hypothetical protein BDZ89DRAFT_971911, partial [Hymenopellis radicata]